MERGREGARVGWQTQPERKLHQGTLRLTISMETTDNAITATPDTRGTFISPKKLTSGININSREDFLGTLGYFTLRVS